VKTPSPKRQGGFGHTCLPQTRHRQGRRHQESGLTNAAVLRGPCGRCLTQSQCQQFHQARRGCIHIRLIRIRRRRVADSRILIEPILYQCAKLERVPGQRRLCQLFKSNHVILPIDRQKRIAPSIRSRVVEIGLHAAKSRSASHLIRRLFALRRQHPHRPARHRASSPTSAKMMAVAHGYRAPRRS